MSELPSYADTPEERRDIRIKRAIEILSVEGATLTNPLFFEDLREMLAELLRLRKENVEFPTARSAVATAEVSP